MGSSLVGKPKMLVNSFLVDGLLIDTGNPAIGKTFQNVLSQEHIEKCVVTHHHEDHSGNALYVTKSLNVPTWASRGCVKILKNPPMVSPIQYFTWGQNRAAHLEALDISQSIQTNNYSLKIIETPGHAEDMISLYEPNEGWLFSADNFVNDYIAIFMNNENMSDQIMSLKKLLALDFDVLLCSHNAQYKNGKSYLKLKLQFLTDLYENVKLRAAKGMTDQEIMNDMKINEYKMVKYGSLGKLSRINMIRSAMKY